MLTNSHHHNSCWRTSVYAALSRLLGDGGIIFSVSGGIDEAKMVDEEEQRSIGCRRWHQHPNYSKTAQQGEGAIVVVHL
jgi:hypothetical protein